MVVCVLFVICSIVAAANAEEQRIFGCSGFVKSPAEHKLIYDRIQVHLVTADGAVKDKTECAPHNGYFFVPTFEQGSYKLRVVPPAGWKFEPSEYEVTVSEGGDNTCEEQKDLNFILAGFTVSGQILTQGSTSGPEGVEVVLQSSDSRSPSARMRTSTHGRFTFSPVMPGSYKVSVQQQQNTDLRLEKNSIAVVLTSDNVDEAEPLLVLGFSVQGSVSSEAEPVIGVKFLLFPAANKHKKTAIDCDTKIVASDGYTDASNGYPECYVVSDAQGKFRFPALIPGKYELVPFYKSGKTQFDVKPSSYKFEIAHSPINISPPFEVSGFSVAGSVKLCNNCAHGAVEGAEVAVNGKVVGVTDAHGRYVLEKMTVGLYTIQISKKDYFFEPLKVQLVPSKPELDTVYASKVSVCGMLEVKHFPKGVESTLARKIDIVSDSSSASASKELKQQITADRMGKFCAMVPVGTKSTFKPVLTSEEKSRGLLLKHSEQQLNVENIVSSEQLVFTQWLTSVSGSVTCYGDCKSCDLKINLSSNKNPSFMYSAAVKPPETNKTKFQFSDVLFDTYTLRIDDSIFCWAKNSFQVDAFSTPKNSYDGFEFMQTGIVMNVETKYDHVTLTYQHNAQSNVKASIADVRSNPRICLPQRGDYRITTSSCFKFANENMVVSTSQSGAAIRVSLEPTQFRVQALVDAASKDFEVFVDVNGKNADASVEFDQQSEKTIITLFSRKGDVVRINLESKTLLFNPNSYSYTTSGESCPATIVTFKGRAGEFLEATLSVETPDVSVEVLDAEGGLVMSRMYSQKRISIGPLEDKSKYSLKFSKPGYVFVNNEDGTVTVNKLASISISVKDESGQALVGALMSVSDGERQYRSNNLTNSEGQLQLLNLGPGQYFIKPLKKEFTFTPANKLLAVEQGENSVVEFRAERTAFTCFGTVKTPSLDVKSSVTVLASGRGAEVRCSHSKEEGVSQSDGSFTILGLQSDCEYDVSVRLDKYLEYSVPLSKRISVSRRDVMGVNFVVFPRLASDFDLNGYVDTDHKFLSTLTVNLYLEEQKNVPIESQSLDQVPFFFFTSLSADEKWYIIKLESTLARSEYSFNSTEHSFQATGTTHHVRLHFSPVVNVADDDVTQGGLFLPLLIVLAGICIYNYQKVKGPLQNFWMTFTRNLSTKGSPFHEGRSNTTQKKKKSVKTN